LYAFREFLDDEENAKYVPEERREAISEKLTKMEEWLYEEGANAQSTIYQRKKTELLEDFDKFKKRKEEHENQD